MTELALCCLRWFSTWPADGSIELLFERRLPVTWVRSVFAFCAFDSWSFLQAKADQLQQLPRFVPSIILAFVHALVFRLFFFRVTLASVPSVKEIIH